MMDRHHYPESEMIDDDTPTRADEEEREHDTSGAECWCDPEIVYCGEDTDTMSPEDTTDNTAPEIQTANAPKQDPVIVRSQCLQFAFQAAGAGMLIDQVESGEGFAKAVPLGDVIAAAANLEEYVLRGRDSLSNQLWPEKFIDLGEVGGEVTG